MVDNEAQWWYALEYGSAHTAREERREVAHSHRGQLTPATPSQGEARAVAVLLVVATYLGSVTLIICVDNVGQWVYT